MQNQNSQSDCPSAEFQSTYDHEREFRQFRLAIEKYAPEVLTQLWVSVRPAFAKRQRETDRPSNAALMSALFEWASRFHLAPTLDDVLRSSSLEVTIDDESWSICVGKELPGRTSKHVVGYDEHLFAILNEVLFEAVRTLRSWQEVDAIEPPSDLRWYDAPQDLPPPHPIAIAARVDSRGVMHSYEVWPLKTLEVRFPEYLPLVESESAAEHRIMGIITKKVQQYLHSEQTRHVTLQRLRKVPKQRGIEDLEYLVRWQVQGWSFDAIAKKYRRKKGTVQSAVNAAGKYVVGKFWNVWKRPPGSPGRKRNSGANREGKRSP